MIETHIAASLLPFLSQHCSFFIELGADSPQFAGQEGPFSPFLVMSESDQLSRLIKAKISTQAKSEIQSLFLLVQKDQYNVNQDSIWPLKNKDVEDAWQRAFTFYSSGRYASRPILLKEQISESGKLLPMASLFYCIPRQVFFDPPCPACAQPLQLCIDDVLLEKSGLQPYSTSLSRYLYCPSCYRNNEKLTFYVPSHNGHYQNKLKDLSQLLDGYGQVVMNKTNGKSFPCSACHEMNVCYGENYLVKSRIVPFSFFPFFMLMFPAATMAAVDFLPLMSGASLKSVENRSATRQDSGRAYCLSRFGERFSDNQYLLFDDNDKIFLEILYLKLSFLSELIESCFPNLDNDGFPDLGLSFDRIWVSLADQNRLLPLLWNFKVELLGVGPGAAIIPKFPKHNPSNVLHFVGSVWFYTLLVNQSQDVAMVFEGIGNMLEDLFSSDLEFTDFKVKKSEYMFLRPENIFWNPAGKKIDIAWESLWDQSLEIGILLLKASRGKDSGWSAHTFFQSLDMLRCNVKEALFQNKEISLYESSKISLEKKEVNKILSNILEKWRATHQAEEQQKRSRPEAFHAQNKPKIDEVNEQEEDADIYETIIISADKFQKNDPIYLKPNNGLETPALVSPNRTDMNEKRENDVSGEVESQATVIVSTSSSDKDSFQSAEMDEDLLKTMILSKNMKSEKGSPFDRQIMSDRSEPDVSVAGSEQNFDEYAGKKKSVTSDEEDDLIDKTFIQHPRRKV